MTETTFTPDDYRFHGCTYLGHGRLAVPQEYARSIAYVDGEDDTRIISVLDIDKIFLPRDVVAEKWWEDMVAQAKQARASHGHGLVVWLPDCVIVAGHYGEQFFHWLSHDVSKDTFYDRLVRGIVVPNPVWPEMTNENMSDSAIQATTIASTYISPKTEASRLLDEVADTAREAGFDIPNTDIFPTDRTLMPHQISPVLSMAYRGKALLGDDVGSGKGSMFFCGFLSLVQWRIERGEDMSDCFPLIVVTKKALSRPIERECHQWYHGVKTAVIGGKTTPETIDRDIEVIVCPISSLDKVVEGLKDFRPQGVVFDESHMVKTMTSRRTQAAVELSEFIRNHSPHPYIVCASATPMPNRPAELWAQLLITGMDAHVMEVADSNFEQKPPARVRVNAKRGNHFTRPVTDQMRFEMRYCGGKVGYYGWEARGHDNEIELHHALLDAGMIRRQKGEFITPLPLLHQRFVRCHISPEQQQRYDVAENEFKDFLVASSRMQARIENWDKQQLLEHISVQLDKANRSEAIMKMTALRQIIGEAKVDYIADWVRRFFDKDPTIVGQDTDRNKLIIFAHHKIVQEAIATHPDIQKFGVEWINSQTKDVNAIVDRFQAQDSGTNIVVCYSEAREGLTLTAAKDVLVAELPFMPSWLIQMGGRCWARVSELYPPHEAHLHYAVADVGIDKYLEEMIRDKGWLHKTIIDGKSASDVLNDGESGEHNQDEFSAYSQVAAKMFAANASARDRSS